MQNKRQIEQKKTELNKSERGKADLNREKNQKNATDNTFYLFYIPLRRNSEKDFVTLSAQHIKKVKTVTYLTIV